MSPLPRRQPGSRALAILAGTLMLVGLTGCGNRSSSANPAQMIKEGWVEFRIGEFDAAISRFDQAISIVGENPDDVMFPAEATYGKAMALLLGHPENGPDVPTQLFNQVAKSAPESDWAAWSLLAIARSTQKNARMTPALATWDQVDKAYQNVIDRFPEHTAGQEALMMQQGVLLIGSDPVKSQVVLARMTGFIATHPTGDMTVIAYQLTSDCCRNLGKPREEIQFRIKAMELREAQSIDKRLDKSATYWSIASRSEFELGDFDLARTYYRKLISEYPADSRVWGAKLALERMNALEDRLRKQIVSGTTSDTTSSDATSSNAATSPAPTSTSPRPQGVTR